MQFRVISWIVLVAAKLVCRQKTEAGSRSPLRNPASSYDRPETTELKLFSEKVIEAGSRSPLHNPASTHGRHEKTAEPKLTLINIDDCDPNG